MPADCAFLRSRSALHSREFLPSSPFMRLSRLALLPLLGLLGGCNYVHFGRLPSEGAAATAPALAQENSELRTEKKILQQELTLARKEGETLRAVVESGKSGATDAALTARLNETTRELATLRASYAKLDAERARLAATPSTSSPEFTALSARLADTQEKLAMSLHSYTSLKEETADLRAEIQQTKTVNAALTSQVQILTVQNSEARAALAQLNTELLAQKDARARASQEADAARAQLSNVLAASRTPAATSLGEARTTSAAGAATLAPEAATLTAPNLPDNELPSTARLSTSRERVAAAASSDPSLAEPLPRTHIVAPGETLEKLAKKFYGSPEKWRILYAANNAQLSLGRPLKVGMVLEVPER
jgi:nucleoid-associated protein YgaU